MEPKSELATVHVVSKHNNAEHATFTMPAELPNSLAPSSVRVRTKLITLSSNNLSYARNGHVLKWWDTYPVPATAPTPYNNNQDWGIVPAWGYGEVVASTIPQFEAGSVLYGFWPTSSLAVDLLLKPIQPDGHWYDISEGRRLLMPLYNRYEAVEQPQKKGTDDDSNEEFRRGWSTGLMAVFGSSFSFNRHVFPGMKGASASTIPLHPFGLGHGWTAEDADLTSAVVVSLSASSKTGRAFAWQFLRNRDVDKNGPLGLLEVTRSPRSLLQHSATSPNIPSTTMVARAVTYENLTDPDTISWIARLKPQRIVIVDFGAEASVVETFVSSVRESLGLPSGKDGHPQSTTPTLKIALIGVGTEMKVLSPEEMQRKQVSGQSLGRIQFNAGGLREKGIENEGADNFFREVNKSFAQYLEDGGHEPLKLSWHCGVAGPDGVEVAWTKLCQGQVVTEEVLVFKI